MWDNTALHNGNSTSSQMTMWWEKARGPHTSYVAVMACVNKLIYLDFIDKLEKMVLTQVEALESLILMLCFKMFSNFILNLLVFMSLHALLHVSSVHTTASFLPCGGTFPHCMLMKSFVFHNFRTYASAIILLGSVCVQFLSPDTKCFCPEVCAEVLSFRWLQALC